MSRDSNGNYSLPSSYNPVVSGTIIDPDWANITLDDISAGLTDSLSRTGKGGMLAPFFLYDGVASAPGMSWISENTSGLYRAAVNDFRYSINGRDVLKLSKTGLTVLGEVTSSAITDSGLKISGAGNKYLSVESTDAPADLKLATMFKGPDGTTQVGIMKDDASAFTKGILLKPGDNKVYDIATNKPFLTDAAGGGTYLPLTGGTLTGPLSVANSVELKTPTAPANRKTAKVVLQNDGNFVFAIVADAGGYGGGLYADGDNSLRVLPGGQRIWHEGNDGTGSGLNADLLRDAAPAVTANSSSIVQRDGSGNINGAIFNGSRLQGGYGNAGTLLGMNGQLHAFGWDGRLKCWVDNGLQFDLARWGSDVNGGGVADPGWFSIGGMYFQWGSVAIATDACQGVNFSRAFPNGCLHVIATSSVAAPLTGNSTLSCHLHSSDRFGCTLCSNESGGTGGTFTVHFLAIGY